MSELKISVPVSQERNELTKLYKKRWLVLAIFSLYGMLNATQWLEFSIVSDLTKQYYNVSSTVVLWTGTVYMAVYVPMLLPAAYVVDNFGLRVAALIGGLGTVLATIIKVFAVNRNAFWVIMCAQTLLAFCKSFITGLPPKIASTWFGPKEISTACGIGIFSFNLGIACNFLLSSTIVRNGEDIGKNFNLLFWIYTSLAIPIGIGIIFLFPAKPDLPPSMLQLNERNSGLQQFNLLEFLKDFRNIFTKKRFVFQLISFSLFNSQLNALAILINEIYQPYFQDSRYVILLGLIGEVCGIIGALTIAIFLDKTHWFKGVCLSLQTALAILNTIQIIILHTEVKAIALFLIAIGGYCSGAYSTAGIEMAVEMTYPSSQMATASILIACGQLVGIISTNVGGWLTETYGNDVGFCFLLALTIISAVVTIFVPDSKNRQIAVNSPRPVDKQKNT